MNSINEEIISTGSAIEFDDFIARELEAADAEAFCAFILKNKNRISASAPVTVRAVTDVASCRAFILDRKEKIKRKEIFAFALFQKNSQKPIGNLVIMNIDWTIPKGEIGYFIDADFEGKGITTLLVKAVCDYAFNDLGFNKMIMRIGNGNKGSRRIAEKNLFQVEGILRKDYRNYENELVDVIYFSKLNPAI